MLLALLLVAQFAGPCHLETSWQAADGADWLPAFNRTRDLIRTRADGSQVPICGTIELGAADYSTSGPWVLTRPITLRGQGAGATFVTGPAPTIARGGQRSVIQGIAFDGLRQYPGLVAMGRFQLKSVSLSQFVGPCLFINTVPVEANANSWSIEDLAIRWCGADGIRVPAFENGVKANDSNMGSAERVQVDLPCQVKGVTSTTTPATRPVCAGVRDDSGIGTTYDHLLVGSSYSVKACPKGPIGWKPPDWCRFPSVMNTRDRGFGSTDVQFVRPYAENGLTAPAELGPLAQVFGSTGYFAVRQDATFHPWIQADSLPTVARAHGYPDLILGDPNSGPAVWVGGGRPGDRPSMGFPAGALYFAITPEAGTGCMRWRAPSANVWACWP